MSGKFDLTPIKAGGLETERCAAIATECMRALLPRAVVRIDQLPTDEELQERLHTLQKALPPPCYSEGEMHPRVAYISVCSNVLSWACDLAMEFKKILKDRPLFPMNVEKGYSYLHHVVLILLLDYSWTDRESWEDELQSTILPALENVKRTFPLRHVFIGAAAAWIRLLISFSVYQEQHEAPEDNEGLDSFDPLSHQMDTDTVERVDYRTLLQEDLRHSHVRFCFETLMDVMNAPPIDGSGCLSEQAGRLIERKCGELLSLQLMRTGGLEASIDYLIDTQCDSENQIISLCTQVICKKPSTATLQEWFYLTASQLITLLTSPPRKRSQETDPSGVFDKVVWAVSSRLIESHTELASTYLLRPILQPLYFFQGLLPLAYGPLPEGEGSADERVIVSEQEMEKPITFLWKLFVVHRPSSKVFTSLSPIIPALFQLHYVLHNSALNQRTRVHDVVVSYFQASDEAGALFKSIIMPPSYQRSPFWETQCLTFGAGGHGGVVLKHKPDARSDAFMQAECIIEVMKECHDDQLVGNLFVDLMNEMQSIPETSRDERYMHLFHYLVQMLEGFGESILQDVVQVCTFLQAILQTDDEKILSIALAIISALLSGALQLREEEIILIYELEPLLEKIELQGSSLSELAGDLRAKILVNDKSSWVFSSETKDKQESNTSHRAGSQETLEEVLKHLSDPLLPVRGHGVVALRQLVLARDSDADANKTKILSIFRHQLDDDDTYIYGGAIAGLMALGDIYPAEIIPILSSEAMDSAKPVEHRLKVNEALLKISQRCGETLPFHVGPLVHCFLISCKDSDRTIRASGLSNIAELAKMLRYGLYPYIQEIIECVYSISQFDRDVEVKRGCIFVVYLLLEGVGVEAFEIIPEHLRKVQDIIKQYLTDADGVTFFHAENAAAHLKDILTWRPPEQQSVLNIVKRR